MDGARGRTRPVLVKDESAAPMMAQLAHFLSTCPSYSCVAKCMNKAGEQAKRPPVNYRGTVLAQWSVSAIRALVNNPIYTGVYVFGEQQKSVVWRTFKQDVITHEVPELAWFTQAQVRAWKKRFVASRSYDRRMRKYPHPLIGILHCVGCGQPMIGYSHHGYACRSKNVPSNCPTRSALSARVAMRLLTELLPTVMADAKRVADEFVRQTAAEDASQDDIAAELSVLQTQQDLIGEQIAELAAKGIKAPALLHDKLRDIQDRMAELSVQQEQRQEQRWDMDRIRLLANALADNPAHYFETLDDDSKARVLRALVRDVRILGEGLGMSRRHRIIRYTSVLTGETWAEGNLECCTPR